jgi:hypothetical protein
VFYNFLAKVASFDIIPMDIVYNYIMPDI